MTTSITPRSIALAVLAGTPTGVFIGMWISVVFNILSGATQWYPSSPEWTNSFPTIHIAIIVSLLLWMAMGALFTLANLIFFMSDINWGITGRTIGHFILTIIGFTVIAISAGWFTLSMNGLLSIFLEFSIIYAVIWGINMFLARRNVNEMNQSLQDTNEQQK